MSKNADAFLDEIEFKMAVTFIAVNPPCLDDVRCFTVNVNLRSGFLAQAGIDELRCDSKVRQVALTSLLVDL